MWTFMRERYGLRQLIVDNMTQIVDAVKCYSGDHDVALFGKILKNVVDEQFWFVSQQVRETVGQLVRHFLRTKGDKTVHDVMADRLDLSKEVWSKVVDRMYDECDTQKLNLLVVESSARGKLKFSLFLQTVLDFQLNEHEKYLQNFVTLFQAQDRDKDGQLVQD